MKLLCNYPTHVHGLDGLFPSITQDHYNAYNIEDEESIPDSAHPIKCTDSKLILKSFHLWNQQSAVSESSKRLHRDTRQVALQQPQEDLGNHSSASAEGKEIKNPLKRHMAFSLVERTLTKRPASLPRQANFISNEQRQMIKTMLGLQRDKIVKTLNSPLCSSNLRRILTSILEDISLLFAQIEQSVTIPEACWFLKMADERVSKETDALLTILRHPRVAIFESQWVVVAEYIERTVLSDSEDLTVSSRKQAISKFLLEFASEMDFSQDQHSGEITNESIQEFRQKSNQRKAHLLAAASAVPEASSQEEIDSALVDLFNKLKRLNYPISSERSLVGKEIFSIPDDLFGLRSQLGEASLRP